jgi:hypothetical protein
VLLQWFADDNRSAVSICVHCKRFCCYDLFLWFFFIAMIFACFVLFCCYDVCGIFFFCLAVPLCSTSPREITSNSSRTSTKSKLYAFYLVQILQPNIFLIQVICLQYFWTIEITCKLKFQISFSGAWIVLFLCIYFILFLVKTLRILTRSVRKQLRAWDAKSKC